MDGPSDAGRRHRRRPLARRRPGPGRSRELKESLHGADHDSAGRPIVVVTGMGVVTSLGAGKADNWKKLTAGESGIRAITRFADRRPEDHASPARSISCRSSRCRRRSCRERLAELATEEAIAQVRHRHARAIFPARCSSPCRRSRSNGRSAASSRRASGANDDVELRRPAARRREPASSRRYHERFLFGSVADHLADKFGTKGSPISLSTACASGATAIQLGVEAIRRGETDAALCVGTDGSVNPESLIRFSLLSALSTQQRSAAQARQAVREEPRRLRHGRGRRRAGAGKPAMPRRRAARKSSA